MIPYGKQTISDEDIAAVVKVLKSDFITQGPVVPEFEQAVADYCQAKYAYAVTNATSALHLACRALNIGPGDQVWTSPNTFVASANCILYCGAEVDFVDIDAKTWNLSIPKLQEKLALAEHQNCLPRAVIAVHFAGQSCDMAAIHSLSRQYGFAIIEDASHAIGGSYQGNKIGCGDYSDITVFSFHPVKIITTGEGGMLLTNNSELAEKISLLRNHGITRDTELMTEASHGGWYYQQLALGYNYRMTDIQAALGLSQLKRLDNQIEKRHQIAEYYHQHLTSLPVTMPWVSADCQSAWHLYVILLDLYAIKKPKKQIFAELRAQGIGVNLHYIPVHTQPYYQQLGFSNGDFPASEAYYQKALTIPMYPELQEQQLVKIRKALHKTLL
jgi:UDP-4-amino-4,6-dideoxy-N-acetyl-beta-L-altrosamine transaminase